MIAMQQARSAMRSHVGRSLCFLARDCRQECRRSRSLKDAPPAVTLSNRLRWDYSDFAADLAPRLVAFLAPACLAVPCPASAALLAAQRLRAASAIRLRPSGLSRRFLGPVLFVTALVVATVPPPPISRRAERARWMAACCCSSCRMILVISFTYLPSGSLLTR